MSETERPLPQNFLLVKYGRNTYTKDGESQTFDFSPEDADAVIAEFSGRGRDLVIDYEHSTLSGNEAPAAGWIDRLEKGEDGLVAHVKYWTERGEEYLESGEYRYFSPTLMMENGKVKALHSVALTNHPALHSVAALVASDINPPDNGAKRKDHSMTKTEKALQRLLGETTLALNDGADDAIASKLEALADELPDLREAKKERDELIAAADLAKKDAAFERGSARGAFCNAQKSTLMKLSLADLKELEKATPDNAAVPTSPLPKPGEAAPEKALTDDEKKIAAAMNLTDEEFAKIKKQIQEKECCNE